MATLLSESDTQLSEAQQEHDSLSVALAAAESKAAQAATDVSELAATVERLHAENEALRQIASTSILL